MRTLLLFSIAPYLASSADTSEAVHQVFEFEEPDGADETLGDRYGQCVAAAGDIDGDGFDDIVIGEPRYSSHEPLMGRIRIQSGRHGAVLLEARGTSASAWFGYSADRAGDFNSDGTADLVVGSPAGAPPEGSASVISGADGSVLQTWSAGPAGARFGHAVAGAGDVDGDGAADVIIGAPNDSSSGLLAGCVRVYSGATGLLLFEASGAKGDRLGSSVAFVGDLDADGYSDWVVGAPLADGLAFNAGSVFIYSGGTGQQLFALHGTGIGDQFGHSVRPAGDVDADGVMDIVVAIPGADASGIDSGAAEVWSGATGERILSIPGVAEGEYLSAACGMGDVDLDGHGDIAVGAASAALGLSEAGRVRILSGVSGAEIRAHTGGVESAWFGAALAAVGDANGDGMPDLAVGAPGHDDVPFFQGFVRVISGASLALSSDRHELSLGSGEAQQLLLSAPNKWAGRPYQVLGSLAGTSPGWVVSGVTIPLAYEPLYFAHTVLHPGTPPLSAGVGALDENGSASASFQFDAGAHAALVGLLLHHAYVALEASGQVGFASNAVPLTLLP